VTKDWVRKDRSYTGTGLVEKRRNYEEEREKKDRTNYKKIKENQKKSPEICTLNPDQVFYERDISRKAKKKREK
jgi:glycine betaine/choline ABC-type transport system substrate-binding protein